MRKFLFLLSFFLAWPVAADAHGVVARSAHCAPAVFSAPVYAPRVFAPPVYSAPVYAPPVFAAPVCAPVYSAPVCAPPAFYAPPAFSYSAAAFAPSYSFGASYAPQFRASVGYGASFGVSGSLAVGRRAGPLERLFGRVGDRRDARAGIRASASFGGAPVAVIRR